MTSPYLIADETVRHMAFALRHLSCGCLDSERERRGAYWDADVRAEDMIHLDAEALRRERTRRRLFGITINMAAITGSVRHAAAASEPMGLANYGHDLVMACKVLIVVAIAIFGFVATAVVLKAAHNALRRRDRRRSISTEADTADEIWS